MPEVKDLVRAAQNSNLLLFVGAGVSMNLGLPSWNQLIAQIAEELGYDPDLFMDFGSNLVLAEYYKATQGSLRPLMDRIAKEWNNENFDCTLSAVKA